MKPALLVYKSSEQMPLYIGAVERIRANFEQIDAGHRAPLIEIGTLTTRQLDSLNEFRATKSLAPMLAQVVLIGSHIYQSRIARDGYTIDDVIDQIVGAMHQGAIVVANHSMTALKSTQPREDRYGNKVKDMAVFECTVRYPRPELFSVIPKGDMVKPKNVKGHSHTRMALRKI